ncbi:hypothetical protein DAPPUDRAFT_96294 [Daphnia pulex]|uniref:Uncharacterized protein n=1 Tax=Daphnia pulex TaxID=6669 RepID=E9FXH3_DAPPU|nr:hypothetical protein DAPPUDRAFT_96294 [Daphnia pulex]|eukprot:EFX88269.1 hypothetical protein DAPPUDRAFT_96294 [Daphnia pulex]
MAISYPRLSPRGLRGLSIFNIILWVFSSVLTIAIVIRYSNFGQGPDYNNIGGLDYIFAGIWAGWFYGVAGIVGIFGSYERKRVQLLTVVTFNVLSLVGASISGCIAGIIGFYIIRKFNEICYPALLLAYDNSDEDCTVWMSLEFALLAFSGIAFFVNLTCLIVTLVAICGPKKSTGLVRMEVGNPAYDFKQRRPSA